MNKNLAMLGMLWLTLATAHAETFSTVPEDPDPADKYLFYLHGSAEEQDGDNDKYQMAIEAAASSAAHVISEIRGETDPNTYARQLKQQVEQLLTKGVPAKNISISGYSKGAVIALASAALIQNPEISYVLLAGCSAELNEKYSIAADKAVGRILAIYDADDDKFGSCSGIVTANGTVLEETGLDSGKGHKLFRIPKEKFISQWRDPMLNWVN